MPQFISILNWLLLPRLGSYAVIKNQAILWITHVKIGKNYGYLWRIKFSIKNEFYKK